MNSQKKKDNALRVTVDGGGCNGMKYIFSFSSEVNEDDIVFSNGKARVLIDQLSLKFLNEAQLDYVTDLGGAAFEIKNPNAKTSCGCGSSFSI